MTLPALFEIHPPPWNVVSADPKPTAWVLVLGANGGYVALAPRSSARLLAAAPGLAEALGKIEAWPALSMLPPLAVVEAMKELSRAALAALKEDA